MLKFRSITNTNFFKGEKQGGRSIMQNAVSLLNYNFSICLYMCYFLFICIWLVVGQIWNAQAGTCLPTSEGNLLKEIHSVALIIMWVFVGGGLLFGIFSLTVRSCEEGSCLCWDMFRFVLQFMTCGLCDISKWGDRWGMLAKNSSLRYSDNKKNYTETRRKWIG
jgi:hypothetical protein